MHTKNFAQCMHVNQSKPSFTAYKVCHKLDKSFLEQVLEQSKLNTRQGYACTSPLFQIQAHHLQTIYNIRLIDERQIWVKS